MSITTGNCKKKPRLGAHVALQATEKASIDTASAQIEAINSGCTTSPLEATRQ